MLPGRENREAICASECLPEDRLGDGLELHVGCAFVNRSDLRVAVKLLDGIILGVAVTAEQLDAERCHAIAYLGRKELRHRAFTRDVLPRILEPCGVVDHEPCRLDVGCRLRDLELDALKLGESLSELLALTEVGDRRGERALGDADHLRADADAPLVEGVDRNLVSLTDRTKNVLCRYLAVVEKQLDGARRADAELVFLLADLESLEVALDDERGDAAITCRWIRVRENDEHSRLG